MPTTPALSVVVPLYNKERHVARAIRSVLDQTYQAFEIVVVDDGSTDGSVAAMDAFSDARIRLIRQPNAGASAARNRGIAEARAPLIAFLDADDAYRPDFLANVLDLQRRYPAAGGYAFNYETVSAEGKRGLGVNVVDASELLLDPLQFFRVGKFGSPVFSSSVAVPRSRLVEAGLFPVGVKLGEDLDTWLRICFHAPIAFDRRPGGIYFQDADERACLIHPPPDRYVFFDTIDRWTAQRRNLSTDLINEIREFKNSFILFHARFEIRFGDVEAGRRALKALHTRVFVMQKWKWLLASYFPRQLQTAMAGVKKAALRSA